MTHMGLIRTDDDRHPRGRLRPPPDYTSRPVKLRLFAIVAALMLVLFVAEKARDPDNWRWFFAMNGPPEAERIDNRAPHRPARTAGQSLDTLVIAADDDEPSEPAGDQKAATGDDKNAESGATRAWTAALNQIWSELTSDERTLLYRLLESAADRRLWPGDERDAADKLLARIEQSFGDYESAARRSLKELVETERQSWSVILEENAGRFREEVQAPLAELAAGTTVLPDQQQHLGALMADLNAINLSRVRDDRPFLMPEEKQLWHHCFWDLQRTSDQELKKRSRGEVAYAQLYRQSGQYRGQVVTVRGTARRAYRVQASKNHLGIEEYFVFWVSPFESADTPLVVYATELPDGFPRLADRNRDGEMTPLREDTVFHGIMFKRGAYAGQNGDYNAPLLLARRPQWQPEPLTIRERESSGQRVLQQAGIAALFIAAVVAGLVYWTTFRRRRIEHPRDDKATQAALRAMEHAEMPQAPRDALAEIERQARGQPPNPGA